MKSSYWLRRVTPFPMRGISYAVWEEYSRNSKLKGRTLTGYVAHASNILFSELSGLVKTGVLVSEGRSYQ